MGNKRFEKNYQKALQDLIPLASSPVSAAYIAVAVALLSEQAHAKKKGIRRIARKARGLIATQQQELREKYKQAQTKAFNESIDTLEPRGRA